jgi:regulator of RNase E activity RraA
LQTGGVESLQKKTKKQTTDTMKRKSILILGMILVLVPVRAQILPRMDMMMFYTKSWTGERFYDGRPMVSDDLLKRVVKLSIEEVWQTLRNEGYNNQYADGFKMIHPDKPFTGRAVTARYMPKRPDVEKLILDKGHADGQKGAANSWPIDQLKTGDVYVAECFGKVVDGTLIGDNLGNSIFSKSKTGVVFDAGARDLEGLEEIEGFNACVRDFHPSYLMETMLMGINVPVIIGNAVVMPGDVVLAKKEGVIFIPPHLLQKVVLNGEFVTLKDQFGHAMLREGRYTPGQIDAAWTDEIKEAFLKWLDANPDKLPMSRLELNDYMKERNW